MKITLTTEHAISLLLEEQGKSWSYKGARALVEHLEELEESTGEDIEFDPVSIRCDWTEWDSLQGWAEDYFSDWKSDLGIQNNDTDEAIDEKIRDYITDNGTLIEFNGGIIVSSF